MDNKKGAGVQTRKCPNFHAPHVVLGVTSYIL
jgi:hypothetical protein